MGVKLIDQNDIIEPYSIPAFRKEVIEHLRIGDFWKRSEDGHTEIKIITQDDDFDAIGQKWEKLVSECDTDIFQTYEWNRVWWKHFGGNKKLHIVAIYAGNKLVGIAPLFNDDVTLFGQTIYSCLRFLGSYVSQPAGEPLLGCISYSDYLYFIIHPGYEQLFYQSLLQHFNEINSDFDEIMLDEVPEKSVMYNTMLPFITKSDYGLNYTVEQASLSPVIKLESTWDGYLESMPRKVRSHARRYFKRSEIENPNAFKIEKIKHIEDLPDVLANFIRMHQLQWNNRGFAGTFSEKRMRDFFIEIAESFYEKDWIQFNTATPANVDMKYVAVDVLITYKNRIYLMHRGMEEDALYRKRGPGNVLLYARLHEAINDGVKVFDMLRGSEEFKLRLATEIKQNKKIILYPAHKTGRLVPGLIKKSMNVIRHIRIEELHIKFMFEGKPFFKGLSDYLQFLYERIKQRSHQ